MQQFQIQTQRAGKVIYANYRQDKSQRADHKQSGSSGFRRAVNYIDKTDLSIKIPRNREKNIIHRAMTNRRVQLAAKESKTPEGTDSIKNGDIQLEGSVLEQGRKNHDHFSAKWSERKQSDSESWKKNWLSNASSLMVSLKEVEGEVEGGKKTALRCRDRRPLKVKLQEVNEAFGQHLNDVFHQKKIDQRTGKSLSDRSFRHLAAEKAKYLNIEIQEGLQEHQLSTQ